MEKIDIFNGIKKSHKDFFAHALELWKEPELSFHEKKSSALQKKVCRNLGFRVKELDSIQPYAFVAEYGTGSPILGLLGEFDALPGLSQKIQGERAPRIPGAPGHACGHNLLGTACLAAAAGIKAAIESGALRGTIRYFGCPAEEQLGKPVLARAGVFSDLDAALSWHPADLNTIAAYATNASVQLEFKFKGKPAHAAQAPHLGRSALDALTLMNLGVEFLREHIPQSARVHYIVTSGGERANIVPEYAAGIYQIRGPGMDEVMPLIERSIDIARGAALMTGTTMSYRFLYGCHDVMPNKILSDLLFENFQIVPPPTYTEKERSLAKTLSATNTEDQRRATLQMLGVDAQAIPTLAQSYLHETTAYWGKGWTIPASTDVGDVSHIAPTAQINTATWPIGVGAHTWQATAASGSSIGMKGMLYAAKIMAGALWDLLKRPEIVAAAQREFRAGAGKTPYKSAQDLIEDLIQKEACSET